MKCVRSNRPPNCSVTRPEQLLIRGIGDVLFSDGVAKDEREKLKLNRTDLRCLSVLAQAGSAGASALADATGLTRGAMTTALDRLEAAGYVQRPWDQQDQQDRRTVRIEMTDRAKKEVAQLYGPLAKEGAQVLDKYTARELAAVVKYLEDGRRLQRAHAQRIRRLIEMERRT